MTDNPRIEELRRRVQTDPASIAFAQLAEEFRRAGDHEEAVRVCRAGLARHPTYMSARVTLGRSLMELQHYNEAQSEFEQVLQAAPENLAAIRGLAEVHQRRGDLREALRHYETALRIAKYDPELEESVYDLQWRLGAPATSDRPSAPTAGDHAANSEPDVIERGSTSVSPEPSPTPLSSLSPELEAAADEFTKALAALDALSLDLPATAPLEPTVQAIESEEDAGTDVDEDEDEEDTTREPVHAVPVSTAMSPHDRAIVNELESWLEAIVRERIERRVGR